MQIRSGDSEAIIEREGGYISSLKFSGRNILLEGDIVHKTHGGCAVLFPYPNRIRDGKYTWYGVEYQLPINSPPNSIHGLLNDTTLELAHSSNDNVVLKGVISNSGYPSQVSVELQYTIQENELNLELKTENKGDLQVPVAFGLHPYFIHGGTWSLYGPESYSFLKYVDKYFPDGEFYSLPANELSSNSERNFDSCFELHDSLKLKCSDRVIEISGNKTRYYVIYNGKWCRSLSVALEPMSAAPDSFNNKMGVECLEPGESSVFRISLRCSFLDQK